MIVLKTFLNWKFLSLSENWHDCLERIPMLKVSQPIRERFSIMNRT